MITKEMIENIEEKEIALIVGEEEYVEGVVHSIKKDEITICKQGDWSKKERYLLSEIKILSVSENPYFSFKHQLELKELKKPLLQFRFDEEDLKNLVGKYATINYDGKIIEGRILSYKFSRRVPNSFIIANDDFEKEIEDYRLRSLEIVESAMELERKNKVLEIYEECYQILREQRRTKPTFSSHSKTDPDTLIEEYLKCCIEKVKGKDPQNNKKCDWVKIKMKEKENSNLSTANEKFYAELKEARQMNDYYNNMIEAIDKVLFKIQNVNWEDYNISQKKGEIETLEYLLESNVITA